MISLALVLCGLVAVWLIWPQLQRRLGWRSPFGPLRRGLRRRKGYRGGRGTPGL